MVFKACKSQSKLETAIQIKKAVALPGFILFFEYELFEKFKRLGLDYCWFKVDDAS
jgi:hypothetical protein